MTLASQIALTIASGSKPPALPSSAPPVCWAGVATILHPPTARLAATTVKAPRKRLLITNDSAARSIGEDAAAVVANGPPRAGPCYFLRAKVSSLAAFAPIDQNAVHQLLLLGGRLLGLDESVGLFDGDLRLLVGRLQHRRLDAARQDRIANIVRAVEADDDDVLAVGGGERGDRAHRHRVVAGDHALDVRIGLQDRLHLGIGFRLAPVGRLLGDALQVRIFADDVVIALGANAGVGVGFLADEFGVIALLAHQLDEFLRAELRALVVVRDDLGHGDAAGVDLAIDQEGRNARVLRLLHGRDGRVGAGVVEDDRLGAARDRGVDELQTACWRRRHGPATARHSQAPSPWLPRLRLRP